MKREKEEFDLAALFSSKARERERKKTKKKEDEEEIY